MFRAAFKPTPSIAAEQRTVNKSGEEIGISIKGRHDPIIVPRAVVVVETMAAFAAADMLLGGMTAVSYTHLDVYKRQSYAYSLEDLQKAIERIKRFVARLDGKTEA